MNFDSSFTTTYFLVITLMKTMNMNLTMITRLFTWKFLIFQLKNSDSQESSRQMKLAFDLKEEK